MSRRRTRAAAGAASLLALGAAVGAGAYLVARDDPGAAIPTTTSTTSTTLSIPAVRDTVAEALLSGLPVTVTEAEAECLATGMVAAVAPEQLRELDPTDPLAGVSDDQRTAILRATIGCLPAGSAAALLGDPTTTSASLDLPDEGG